MVSFTFNLPKKRCIVRVMDSVSAKSLCQTISDTKVLSAEQVVKNKSGEEVNDFFIVLYLSRYFDRVFIISATLTRFFNQKVIH